MEIKFSGTPAEVREEIETFLNGGESAPAADKAPAKRTSTTKKTETKEAELTIDDLRTIAAATKERTGKSIAPVLSEFKAAKLSDVKVADYAKFKAALEDFTGEDDLD